MRVANSLLCPLLCPLSNRCQLAVAPVVNSLSCPLLFPVVNLDVTVVRRCLSPERCSGFKRNFIFGTLSTDLLLSPVCCCPPADVTVVRRPSNIVPVSLEFLQNVVDLLLSREFLGDVVELLLLSPLSTRCCNRCQLVVPRRDRRSSFSLQHRSSFTGISCPCCCLVVVPQCVVVPSALLPPRRNSRSPSTILPVSSKFLLGDVVNLLSSQEFLDNVVVVVVPVVNLLYLDVTAVRRFPSNTVLVFNGISSWERRRLVVVAVVNLLSPLSTCCAST